MCVFTSYRQVCCTSAFGMVCCLVCVCVNVFSDTVYFSKGLLPMQKVVCQVLEKLSETSNLTNQFVVNIKGLRSVCFRITTAMTTLC